MITWELSSRIMSGGIIDKKEYELILNNTTFVFISQNYGVWFRVKMEWNDGGSVDPLTFYVRYPQFFQVDSGLDILGYLNDT